MAACANCNRRSFDLDRDDICFHCCQAEGRIKLPINKNMEILVIISVIMITVIVFLFGSLLFRFGW